MEPVSDAKQRLLHADPAVSGEDAQTIDLRGVERATGSRNGVFGRVFGIFGIFFETNVGRAVARVRAHGDESDERKRAVRGVDISRSGVDISHSGVDISHSGVDISHFGVDISHSGVDISHFGVDISHFGVDISHSGVDISHFGVDISHFGVDISHSGVDISHSGVDISHSVAFSARFSPRAPSPFARFSSGSTRAS